MVGAGPTGLTLAAVLASCGVEATVIDAAPGPERESSRATTVHAATLELLDRLDGAGAEIAARAQRAGTSTLWSGSRRLARVRWERMPTPYAGIFNLRQAETEAILRRRLEALGGKITWGTKATEVRPGGSGVLVDVSYEGQPRALSARYVVGCDGGHSIVRRSLGIALEGATHDERFLLGDVRLRTDLARDQTYIFVSTSGVLGVMPLADGSFRLNGTLAEGESLTPAGLPALMASRLGGRGGVDLAEVEWLAEYRTHSRLASPYRVEGAFLAGDAAHLNSPVGGQGMNLGIGDAANLGWKLARVLRGAAPEALLETYQSERRPLAADVLRATEASTRMITARRPLERALRNAAMRVAHRLPPVQAKLSLEPAGLTQGYASRAAATRRRRRGLRAGQRLPSVRLERSPEQWLHACLPGFEYDLLVLAPEPLPNSLVELARSNRVRVRRVASDGAGGDDVIADRDGALAGSIGRVAAVLVRPDGVVAWAGAAGESLRLHLQAEVGALEPPVYSRAG